jgi:hypothetical protein
MFRPLIYSFMSFILFTQSSNASELKFWMRAFIPNKHPTNPTYVLSVPGRTGKWMIPAPSLGPLDKLVNVASDVPISADTCFGTDDRTFSSTLNASARVSTALRMAVDGGINVKPLVGNSISFTGQSVAYSCSTGAELASKPGKLERASLGGPHIAGDKLQLILQASGSMPFFAGALDIDYSIDLTYDRSTKQLAYKITTDRFPSYEAYAQLDDGSVKRLIAQDPSGDTVWSLFDLGTGIGQRTVSGQQGL